jgi:O-antigen ligase
VGLLKQLIGIWKEILFSIFTAQNDKITRVHFLIISLLIITFPYYISNAWIGTLSILSFLVIIYQKSFNLKIILKENSIVILFIFILFTYLSVFWSDVAILGENSDFNTNINRFKYYFLLIPSIYFSKFSKKDISKLFFFLALSSFPIIIIYYLNSFGYISYYSNHYGGESNILRSDLQENIFILFTAIYIYTYLLISLQKKKLITSILLFLLLSFVSTAMIIDPITNSRITLLVLAIILVIGPIYVFRKKYLILLPFVFIISILILSQEKSIDRGLNDFRTAINEDNYVSSWGFRTGLVIVGSKIFINNPIFGSGINDTTTDIIKIKISSPKYFKAVKDLLKLHNDHLSILVQTGIIGYALFLYFIYLFFIIKISDHKLNIFKNLFIIAFFIIMIAEHYLTDKYSTNVLAIVFALSVLYNKLDKEKSTDSQS